jgi:hypothetical protein
VLIDPLLQLIGTRFNDEQLKSETITIMAAVRDCFTHLNSLLSWRSCPVAPKRLPIQNRVLAARGMKLT